MARQLFHFPLCPFSRKVRILLGEQKLEVTLVVEPFWNHRKEFLDLNPAGQVPVLVDDILVDPRKLPVPKVLSNSDAICQYLNEAYYEGVFMKGDVFEKAEIRRLTAWFDEKFFTEVSGPILYEKVFKRYLGGGGPDSGRIRRALIACERHLAYIDKILTDRYWLAGDGYSLADITASAHLSTMDYFGSVRWDPCPMAKEWYSRLKCRPSFKSLLKDRVSGIMPSSSYEDLDF